MSKKFNLYLRTISPMQTRRTMMRAVHPIILVSILLLTLSLTMVTALTEMSFGGKSGDWAEYQLNGPVLSGEMLRMEFQNVSGTNVTVNITVYTTSLTELNEFRNINLASENANDDFPLEPWFNARVYFVPSGLAVNDSVYLGQGFGNVTIIGDTTKPYAGADREVIYANFTQQNYDYVFYWDKQTGLLTEGTRTFGAGVTDVVLNETSMWGWIAIWWLWILVAIAIALGILTSRKSIMMKLRKKSNTQSSPAKPISSAKFSKEHSANSAPRSGSTPNIIYGSFGQSLET